MAEFYQGTKLNVVLEDIFENAENELILISPYIKLHPRFKDILNLKKDDFDLKIQIVFGKNKGKEYLSFNEKDFNYLKGFPNIEIRYNERLHAKYYANDKCALLSSMNLYDYSQNNNIEFGILTTASSLTKLGEYVKPLFKTNDSLDNDAYTYFSEILKSSPIKYHRKPKFEKKNKNAEKGYSGSKTKIDLLSELFNSQKKSSAKISEIGYCIRTGEKIPFNPKHPMSKKAWKIWNEYANENFSEKYCHQTGKPSNGKNSMKNPIISQ